MGDLLITSTFQIIWDEVIIQSQNFMKNVDQKAVIKSREHHWPSLASNRILEEKQQGGKQTKIRQPKGKISFPLLSKK